MSGFCGFAGKVNEDILQKMLSCLRTDCSYAPICFDDGYVHLGYVPYTKEDLNKVGHNDNYTIWVMLDTDGSKEMTPSSVIASYEKNGPAFLKEADGIFSGILWDGIRKRLYLFRDRYGAKPLFYAKTEEGLVFGSNINAVLTHNSVSKNVNFQAVYEYLSFQSVYAPETVFMDVRHILPGCYGIYERELIRENGYAKLPFGEVSKDDFEQAAQKTDELLKQSVGKNLIVDGSGIFLSGGLDSSYIAALANGKFKYSFCLKPQTNKNSIHNKEEDAFFAGYLAKEYGMEHYIFEMTPTDLIDSVDDILKAFSQPFSGTVSTYFLAKKASDICKTIYTGDGADELFGSYRHHSVLPALEKYIAYKKSGVDPCVKKKEFAPYEDSLSFLESVYQFGGEKDTLWYYRLLQMTDDDKGLFLNEDRFGPFVKRKATLNRIWQWDSMLQSKDSVNRSLERDFKHLLPGHTMLYQDTLARRFGINLNMPFLNRTLTDYVVTLPGEYKIRDGQTKALLKHAAKCRLPKEIVERRKEPFSLPILEWLKGELKEYLTDMLSESSIKRHGLLDEKSIQYALSEFYRHPDEKEYYGLLLWSLAMLERWAFLYI